MSKILRVACEPIPLEVPTLHTEKLQQPEASSVQPASLRLRWGLVLKLEFSFSFSLLNPGSQGWLVREH